MTMKTTPWGIADHKEVLADGIISYSTPSHGGIWLSEERRRQLPEGINNFLGSYEWWEEDCDWSIPYLWFREDIQKHGTAYKLEENMVSALAVAKRHHPELSYQNTIRG